MKHHCPRCGYDQTGVVDSWKESCPLAGTCSECGLELDWRHVLNPVFSRQYDFFEHAIRHKARAWWSTVRRTWRPGRFWGWVRMEHQLRPARMIAVCGPGAALSFSIGVAIILTGFLVSAALRGFIFESGFPDPLRSISQVIRQREDLMLGAYRHLAPAWIAVTPLMGLLLPLTMLLLPVSFRRARIRRMHIVRIWAYSCIGYALWWHATACLHVIAVTLADPLSLLFGSTRWFAALDRWAFWAIPLAVVAVPGLFLADWWRRACRDYLLLPRPGLIAAVLSVLAFVIAAVLITAYAFIEPDILNGDTPYTDSFSSAWWNSYF